MKMCERFIALPETDKVYFICDPHTEYEMVMHKSINDLYLYELMNLDKYGYYTTKQKAEKHLKGE